MSSQTTSSLSSLYEHDETAWLEQMAELIVQKRFDEIDHANLAEYLTDMAKRDRREVYSRLVVLLTHLLKWEYQAEHRTKSWKLTINAQRSELRQLLESRSLRRHAEGVFAKAYQDAVERATIETELSEHTFPSQPTWTLDEVLTD